MNIKYAIKTALIGLMTNKFRSFLTMLGIMIGVSAIILIVSIGTGAQNMIMGEIQSMGSNNLFILPGKKTEAMSNGGFSTIFNDSLKERDLELLLKKSNVPNAKRIMPIVFGSELAQYRGEVYRAMIMGSTDKIFDIYSVFPAEGGDIFYEDEIDSKANVVVIGSKVKEELFGELSAVGEKIRIKDRSYKVIGVLPKKGQVSLINLDEAIFLPYTTAQQYIFGIKYFNRLILEIDKEENIQIATADVEAVLRDSHDIDNPDDDDFYIQTTEGMMDMIGTVMDVLTLFLASVAGVSLIVGGVGIMNIILVSVTERTREIGLRKSLGATNKDILYQFLFESVFITFLGGVAGIIFGSIFSWIASYILTNFANMNWPYTFSVEAALLGFGVSAFIGLVFGIYPAKKASKLSPIEALRRE